MKKINKKGFFLSETMVVIAVVAVVILSIFKLFNSVYYRFIETENYNTANAINALSNIKKYYESIGNIDTKVITKDISYIELTNEEKYESEYYTRLKNEFKIDSIYLIDLNKLNDTSDFYINLRKYLDTLRNEQGIILLVSINGNEFAYTEVAGYSMVTLVGNKEDEFAVYLPINGIFVDPGYRNWEGEEPTTTWENGKELDTSKAGTYYLHYDFNGRLLRRKIVVGNFAFSTDDWDTIIKLAKIGNHPYEVGDIKTIEMDINADGTAEEYTIRVANTTPCEGLSITTKSACGFVLEFADIITTHAMNGTDTASSTNAGGWPASAMREYLNDLDASSEEDGVIYNALPEELRAGIINTYVVSSHGNGDTTGELENDNFGSTDKLYLLSPQEVYGTSFTNEYDSTNGTSRQLDYYKDNGVSTSNYAGAIKNNSSGSASVWWLRSARSNISSTFYYVTTSGGWDHGISYYGSNGVSPAFRLAE